MQNFMYIVTVPFPKLYDLSNLSKIQKTVHLSDRHETQLRICLDEFCIVKIKHQLPALLAQQAALAQLAALRPTL